MTIGNSAIIEWFATHPNAAPYIGLYLMFVMIFCPVFACVMLWQIRQHSADTKDETRLSRMILNDLEKSVDQFVADKRLKGIAPKTGSRNPCDRPTSENR